MATSGTLWWGRTNFPSDDVTVMCGDRLGDGGHWRLDYYDMDTLTEVYGLLVEHLVDHHQMTYVEGVAQARLLLDGTAPVMA